MIVSVRARRWAPFVCLLGFVCALIVLLGPAGAARADTDPGSVTYALTQGSDTTCTKGMTDGSTNGQGFAIPDGSCLTWGGNGVGTYQNGNKNPWVGFDLSKGPALPVNSSGFTVVNMMVCYLNSVTNQVYCTDQQLHSASEMPTVAGSPSGADAHAYWLNWDNDAAPLDGSFAGTLCFSLDIHRCGFLNSEGNAHGTPNSNEIGHQAALGKYKPAGGTALPGQQADGSVDPVQCILDTNKDTANSGAFDPLAFIFAPVKCAFLWATTPPTNMVPDLVKEQTDLWDSTSLGKTINSVDFYDALSFDNSCDGILLPVSKLKVAGGPTPDDIHFMSACSGQLVPIASLVNIGLTLTVLVGGAWKIIAMISQFVHGPNPEGGDRWEDTRLF